MPIKEVLEETHFNVKLIKLLTVLDNCCHPPQPGYVYKILLDVRF